MTFPADPGTWAIVGAGVMVILLVVVVVVYAKKSKSPKSSKLTDSTTPMTAEALVAETIIDDDDNLNNEHSGRDTYNLGYDENNANSLRSHRADSGALIQYPIRLISFDTAPRRELTDPLASLANGTTGRLITPITLVPNWSLSRVWELINPDQSTNITTITPEFDDIDWIDEDRRTAVSGSTKKWTQAKPYDEDMNRRGDVGIKSQMYTHVMKHDKNIITFASGMYGANDSATADFFSGSFTIDGSAASPSNLRFSCLYSRKKGANRKADVITVSVLSGCYAKGKPITAIIINILADNPTAVVNKSKNILTANAANKNPFVGTDVVASINCLSKSYKTKKFFTRKLTEVFTRSSAFEYVEKSLNCLQMDNHSLAELDKMFSNTATTTVYKTSFIVCSSSLSQFVQNKLDVTQRPFFKVYSLPADATAPPPSSDTVRTRSKRSAAMDPTIPPYPFRHIPRQDTEYLDESTASEFEDDDDDDQSDATEHSGDDTGEDAFDSLTINEDLNSIHEEIYAVSSHHAKLPPLQLRRRNNDNNYDPSAPVASEVGDEFDERLEEE